jgi:hypothetical protein
VEAPERTLRWTWRRLAELQAASYIFMDAEYAKVALDDDPEEPI